MEDAEQDEKKQREMNMVNFIGKERGLFLFEDEMRQLKICLKELNIFTSSFEKMCDLLTKRAH